MKNVSSIPDIVIISLNILIISSLRKIILTSIFLIQPLLNLISNFLPTQNSGMIYMMIYIKLICIFITSFSQCLIFAKVKAIRFANL